MLYIVYSFNNNIYSNIEILIPSHILAMLSHDRD